jgi:hypothetical protein
MKESLIFIVNAFHKLLVYFMIFGCLLPPKYLWIHILLWPVVLIHWQFNKGKCCLTQFELYLKHNTCREDSPTVENDHGGDYYFVKSILADVNIHLTNEQMHMGTRVLFSTTWLISLVRYLTYKEWFAKRSLKEKEDK